MPDSKTPDEPFDDIIEMFRNIAENGAEPTRAPAPVSAPVARDDSAADASVLVEAASAQGVSPVTSAAPIPVEPATPRRHVKVDPAPVAATSAGVAEPATASASTADMAVMADTADAATEVGAPAAETAGAPTEGVVPVSTIEKLLAPTPRTAPVPGPYVGLPKPEAPAEPSLHSEPEALAAVINGTSAAEPLTPAAPVAGDDVVLTAALAAPGSVPPRTSTPVAGGDGRRRRGVVIIAGVAAAALLAGGGAYALEHHSPSKNTSDTGHHGVTTTFGASPTPAPTLTPSPSVTASPKQRHKRAAVVPPSIAVPSSVPTVAPSSLAAAQAAAQASQSAALASASASLSAAIIAKEQQLAKHYTAVVSAYYKAVAPLAQSFAGVVTNAPTISPKDTPSAADVNAFYSAVTKASHYYNAVRAVRAPSTLAGAQSRLLAAMASARNNLINGQNVTLNAQSCSTDTCTYGDQRGWASYTSTLSNTWSFPQAALNWQTSVSKLLAGKG